MDVEIAGVRFRLAAPAGVEIFEPLATYEEFVAPRASSAGRLDVTVDLEIAPSPEAPADSPIFEAESWRAYREGDEILLAWRRMGEGERLWVAHLDSGRLRCRVVCGTALVEQGEGILKLRNPVSYPLDQLLLDFLLSTRRGLLVHAAGVARDGGGVVLAGRSGAGKSTLTAALGSRADLTRLSDDRLVLREIGGVMRVYGTPWAGEGQVAANDSMPLQAIAFLHQAERESLRCIDAANAMKQLLPVASVLWFDEERTAHTLAFCEHLLRTVPTYELHFRRHHEDSSWLDEVLGSP